MNYFQRVRDKEIRKHLRDSTNLYVDAKNNGGIRLIEYKDIRNCAKGITTVEELLTKTWFIPF